MESSRPSEGYYAVRLMCGTAENDLLQVQHENPVR